MCIYSFAVVYFYCCFLVVSFSSFLLCFRAPGFFFFFSLLKPARFLFALIILPLCKLKIKIPSHTNTRARAVYTDTITGIPRWNAADAFSSSPPVNCACTSGKYQVCFMHFALLQSRFLPLLYELIRALLFISGFYQSWGCSFASFSSSSIFHALTFASFLGVSLPPKS